MRRIAYDKPATWRWSIQFQWPMCGIIVAGRRGIFVGRIVDMKRLDSWPERGGKLPEKWTLDLVTYPDPEAFFDDLCARTERGEITYEEAT